MLAFSACTSFKGARNPAPGAADVAGPAGISGRPGTSGATDTGNTSGKPDAGDAGIVDALAGARFALLGEVHDNPDLHRLRLSWLEKLAGRRRFAIAMEQFDVVKGPLLSAAAASIRSRLARYPALALAPLARELAEAGGFSFQGWDWPLYEPVIELALARNLPLVAANLSTREASAVARGDPGPQGLGDPPSGWTEADDAKMAEAIRDGHCGLLPESVVPALVRAQLARDQTMAVAMRDAARQTALPVVLLAGNGHVRTDIAVPRHLRELEPGATILAIAIGERGAVPPGSFDRVVATIAPVEREDPCESLRRRFGAHRESG